VVALMRTWRFWSVSAPIALGLAAQVGVLTHLVAIVTPMLGASGSARASVTVVMYRSCQASWNSKPTCQMAAPCASMWPAMGSGGS
jgi:hypothetical protein